MAYRIITRYSTFLWPILAGLISLSLFVTTPPNHPRFPEIASWEGPTFNLYHVLCLLYLLFSAMHHMVLSYRTLAFDRLVNDPLFVGRLVPGVMVSTDKKFSGPNVVWCFLFGLANLFISLFQALYVAELLLFKVFFWAVFASSVLVIVSELMMALFIRHNLQSALVSEELGIQFENALQSDPRACRYLFSVSDHNITV